MTTPRKSSPGAVAGERLTRVRVEQEAGVIVEAVGDPHIGAVLKLDLGAVDLPQVVGDETLEALVELAALLGLIDDEVVTS